MGVYATLLVVLLLLTNFHMLSISFVYLPLSRFLSFPGLLVRSG